MISIFSGFRILGITKPIVAVLLKFKPLANQFGMYSVSAIILSIFAFVSFSTFSWWFSTRDTVATDTPAFSAICCIFMILLKNNDKRPKHRLIEPQTMFRPLITGLPFLILIIL